MITEEDKSLFLLEVNDATPLKNQNKTEQYSKELIKHQTKTTIRKVKTRQKNRVKTVNSEKHPNRTFVSSVTSHEKVLYHQKGIRIQELSKLKKGDFTNQAQLDLHGCTRDEAEMAIQEFIANAYHEQFRYIRIIHGKGYNSDEQFPVIKNLVNQELRQLKAVIAFCSAPEKDGGTGAINIFLKSQ